MIKHIVLFKVKDEYKKDLPMVKEVMLSMEQNVPTVKAIQVGIDFLHSSRSYDIVLEVLLEKEDLDNYQNDPYHIERVKKLMQKIQESCVAIDFEI